MQCKPCQIVMIRSKTKHILHHIYIVHQDDETEGKLVAGSRNVLKQRQVFTSDGV